MKKVLKAGCILVDLEKKKVALVYRDYLNDYSFPKGHLEKGESLIECAIREVEEETKRIPIIINNNLIYIDNYTSLNGDNNVVYYYLAIDGGISHNDSLDTHQVVWIDYNNVELKLSYDSLKNIWSSVKNIVFELDK